MRVDVQELGACKRRLEIEESPEVVSQAWERAFERVRQGARLPGFRKGKVPRSMIKLHFADDVRQEVARQLIPEVYRQALEETRLDPVEDPDVQDVTLEESAALKFAAVVEIKPDIALGQYAGVAVTHTPRPLTDAEVDEALAGLQEQQAEYRAVDRPADVGDLVIVDYTLTPEGMDPRAETGYELVIGKNQVMPEIEEALIGLARDGSRTTRVRFPESHPNEALRGKAGEAHVRVTEVKEKVLPALDDEFAKTLGDFATLDALRAELRTSLERRREQENRAGLERAVMEAVLAQHAFDVPEALVLRQVGMQIEHTREHLRRQGMDPDRLPWDYAKMLEDMRPQATQSVRRALLIERIARQENLEPTEADVDAEVQRLAEGSGRPAPAVRAMLERGGDLDRMRFALRDKRVMDFLIERAQVTG